MHFVCFDIPYKVGKVYLRNLVHINAVLDETQRGPDRHTIFTHQAFHNTEKTIHEQLKDHNFQESLVYKLIISSLPYKGQWQIVKFN